MEFRTIGTGEITLPRNYVGTKCGAIFDLKATQVGLLTKEKKVIVSGGRGKNFKERILN